MSNQSENPLNNLFATSKRSKDYRAKKKEKGYRTVSYLLHEQTIEKIKELKDYHRINQTDVVAKSIDQLYDARNKQEHKQDTTSSNTRENQENLVEHLQQELREKNDQIRSLIQSQLEANKIVGAFQVKMGYLEEKKPEPEEGRQEWGSPNDDDKPHYEQQFKKKKKKKKKRKNK
jgi:hypothetical protein